MTQTNYYKALNEFYNVLDTNEKNNLEYFFAKWRDEMLENANDEERNGRSFKKFMWIFNLYHENEIEYRNPQTYLTEAREIYKKRIIEKGEL